VKNCKTTLEKGILSSEDNILASRHAYAPSGCPIRDFLIRSSILPYIVSKWQAKNIFFKTVSTLHYFISTYEYS